MFKEDILSYINKKIFAHHDKYNMYIYDLKFVCGFKQLYYFYYFYFCGTSRYFR